MNALVERFFPFALRGADADVQRRARLTLQVSFIGMVIGVLYTPIHLSHPNYVGATSSTLAIFTYLAIVFTFQRTASLPLVAHLLGANILLVVMVTIVSTGGLHSPALPWLVFAPVVSTLIGGKAIGRIWCGTVVLIVLVLAFMEFNGLNMQSAVPESRRMTTQILAMIFFTIILFIIISVFETGKEQLLRLLREEQASTQAKVEETRAALRQEQETMRRKDHITLEQSQQQEQYLEHSVQDILTNVEKFSNGDLTIRMSSERNADNIAHLTSGLNTAIEHISALLLKVRETADAVAESSTNILNGTEQMTHNAAEQSRKASEANAVMSDLATQIQAGAREARGYAEVAQGTVKSSEEGSMRVRQAIEGMGAIAMIVSQSAETIRTLGESSNQIGEIVQVINEIADQTNLLALNAAIEAARAGDQGRGFAVVADEVRKLAERTTKATKEIATMINRIQHDTKQAVMTIERGTSEVERGMGLVDDAGRAFTVTTENASRGIEAYSQIASTRERHSREINELAQSVEHITSMVSEGVEMTHHIEHSLESLAALAQELQHLLSRFVFTDSDVKGQISSGSAGGRYLA
jgi:methyl-accepting chemotaxis protein